MDSSEEKPPLSARIAARLAASRFFTFSALIHVVLIFLGGSVVLFKSIQEPPDFAASEGGLVASDVQVQAPPEQPPDMTQQTFTPQTPTLNAPTLSAISTTNMTTPTFQVAAAVPVMKAVSSDQMSKALENAAKSMAKGSPTGVPGAMSGRMGGTARAVAMKEMGGKKESEEAVLRGLRWLVKTQNPDGSWAKTHKTAMTGFGLLSFLGHGETPVSAEFGPTVQKALDYLLAESGKNDGRLSGAAGTFGQPGVYAHGIASYALGEYYTMTKDERVAEPLKKAIGYIVKGQSPDGSWRYDYNNSNHADTSVTGWQIQALKAAHLTGLNIEGVDPALDKSMLYLKSVQGPKGGFGYKERGDGYSLTGVGVLCTYFWKQDKDKLVREGIDFMMDQTDKNFPVDYKGDKADLYAWYYNTQACLMVGGAAWTKWNRLFQDQIVKNQNPDGSWPPVAGKSAGGELQKDPEGAGPFYRTNLCILMLEVYYRYTPTMK